MHWVKGKKNPKKEKAIMIKRIQTRLPRREIEDIAKIIDWFPKIIL